MHEVRVKLRWLSAEEGGRKTPFAAARCATISRFPEQGDHWPDGSWTVVVEFDAASSGGINPDLGTARFLVPEAPQHWLHPGQTFGLYEGVRRVADVEVLA